MSSDPPQNDPSSSIRAALNIHGFAFNYAVIDSIAALAKKGIIWQFVGTEVPLTLNGEEIHADLVYFNPSRNIYIVGECKRPDPALAHWCFARSVYAFGHGDNLRPTVDQLYRETNAAHVHLRPRVVRLGHQGYQVGIAMKTHQKGEGCYSDRKAIQDSVTQVMRAANGFIALSALNFRLASPPPDREPVTFVPVVFTTAKLSVSDYDLGTSDLAAGTVPVTATFAPAEWLWYHHPLNLSMQANVHGRYTAEHWADWSDYFLKTSVRSAAIVNAAGIEQFLSVLGNLF